MRRADIILEKSKKLREEQKKYVVVTNEESRHSSQLRQQKSTRTDWKEEPWSIDASERKRIQHQLRSVSTTATRSPLRAVDTNLHEVGHNDSSGKAGIMLSGSRTTDDAAYESGDAANISEFDISLPLSPDTMSMVNTSLSNNTDFATLINDNDFVECASVICVALPKLNECSRPESNLRDSEAPVQSGTILDIIMQPPGPISDATVEDPESPATVDLSYQIQPPDMSTNTSQVMPQASVQSGTSLDITMQPPGPISDTTVEDPESVATVDISDQVQPANLSAANIQVLPEAPVQAYNSEIGLTSTFKKQKARNGLADNSKWQKVQRKQQRMYGEAYCSSTKGTDGEYIVQEPRMIGERCSSKRCSKAKRCNDLSEEDRQRIFRKFWKDLDWGQRKIYTASLVDKGNVKRRKVEDSRRQCSITYHLRKDGERLEVCREMFLSTLCLGEWSVRKWVMDSTDGMHSRKVPMTSRHSETAERRESVRKFLGDLPKLPSHYCRATTSKEYLEPHFQSVAEVYRVYKEEQVGHDVPSRQVFAEEFRNMNLGLFMPKKDQCDKCSAYKVGNLPQQDYDEHILRKEEARMSKAEDKKRAEEGQCYVLTMDVQAVQQVPYLQASALYFKQKLAVHNFTLYNLANDDVVCYVWHEGEGELNANIFTSCVTNYLDNEIECDKEVIIYSDGCGCQNRNATLSNALSALANKKGISITQKYLEKGHTQMECDSVHSVIERRKKHRDLHSPAQYVQLIKEARLKTPYKVHYVQRDFFKDYSNLRMYSSIRPGRKVGDPTVADLRCIKYLPSGEIQWKLRHTDEWQLLLQPRHSAIHGCDTADIKPLYSSSIQIKQDKYRDLQSLKSVIMSDFHSFYDNLSHQ